jgi:hypothetical protein
MCKYDRVSDIHERRYTEVMKPLMMSGKMHRSTKETMETEVRSRITGVMDAYKGGDIVTIASVCLHS